MRPKGDILASFTVREKGYHRKLLLLITGFLLLPFVLFQNCSQLYSLTKILPSQGDNSPVLDITPFWQAFHLRSESQFKAGIVGGEGMQMIQMAQYAPSNPNIVYFVVDTSQVWRSNDSGVTWLPKHEGFRSMGGVSLVVDPRNENVVFVSGALASGVSAVDGIYRTLDGGDSWTLVKQTYYEKGESDIQKPGEGQHYVFDPASFDGVRHQTIYASTHHEGLFKSIDGGTTWKALGLSGTKILDLELHRIGSTVVIYLATNHYVNQSETGLIKMTESNNEIIFENIGNLPHFPRTIALAAAPNSFGNDILYAACGNFNNIKSSIYKSIDGGATFQSIDPDPNNNKEYRSISMSLADSNVLYVMPDQENTRRPYPPYFTRDGGATWNYPSSISGLDEIHTLPYAERAIPVAPHPTDKNIALGFFDGNSPRKTTDGGFNWRYSGNGYSGGRRVGGFSSYFDPNNPLLMAYFLFDFGTVISFNGGQSFKRLTPTTMGLSKTAAAGAINPANPQIMLVAGGEWSEQTLYFSSDAGTHWVQSSTDNNQAVRGNFHLVAYHPQDSNFVYAATDSESWTSTDQGRTFSKLAGIAVYALSPSNGDIVIGVDSNKKLVQSSNRGSSFLEVAEMPAPQIRAMAIDPQNQSRFLLAFSNDLYLWDGTLMTAIGVKGGITKEKMGGSSANAWISTMLVDPFNSSNIYVGTRAGPVGHRDEFIFASKDGGKSFQSLRLNLPSNSSVWALAMDPHSRRLHMCTAHGNFILIE